jgi:hypothetical protein
MQRSDSTPGTERTRPTDLVIAVHGVGDTSPGELRSSVAATIAAAVDTDMSIGVEEFCWNEFVLQSSMRGGSPRLHPHRLSRSLVSAAYHGLDSKSAMQRVLTIMTHAALTFGSIPLVVIGLTLIVLGVAVLFLWGIDAALWLRGEGEPFARMNWSWHLVMTVIDAGVKYGELLAAMLALVTACATVASLWECLREWSPRPLCVLLRRVVFLLVLVPTTSMAQVQWVASKRRAANDKVLGFLLIACLGLGLSAALSLVVNLLFGSVSYFLPTVFAGGMLGLFTITAFAVCTYFLGVMLRAMLSPWRPVVKIILDVSLYLGRGSYRGHLQSRFDAFLESLTVSPDTRIHIVAHSLGSIIAVDSLLNSSYWRKHRRVTLITCGSPLRRLVVRFFPNLYLPADLTSVARLIARRVREFRWVNVYRPLDYIGGRLGLCAGGVDVCTWQFFRSHTGYWTDAKVCELIIASLSQSSVRASTERPAPTWRQQPSPRLAGLKRLSRGVEGLAQVAAGCGALTAAGGVLFFTWQALGAQTLSVAMTPGTATVSHQRRLWVGDDSSVTHLFEFHIRPATPAAPPVDLEVEWQGRLGLSNPPGFSYKALASYIRGACNERGGRPDRWIWLLGKCTRDGIQVMFNAEHMAVTVPAFPPWDSRFGSVRIVLAGATMVFFGGAIGAQAGAVLGRLSSGWALLMLGGRWRARA